MPVFFNSGTPRGHRWMWFALFALALFFSVSAWAATFEEMLKKAEQGDADTQYKLGAVYANCQVFTCLTCSTEKCFGLAYVNGQDVTKDVEEAVRWYRKAAGQGFALAQYKLGAMYRNGRGVAKNYAEAIKWFQEAGEQGVAAAQFGLGLMYAEGQGVAQNGEEAVKWYRKAAEQGEAGAQMILGMLYASGADSVGVAQNYATAYM
jgi:TPR repeat protein